MPSSTSLNERATSPLIGNERHVSFAPLPHDNSDEFPTPSIERSSLVTGTGANNPPEPDGPTWSTTNTAEPPADNTTPAPTINPDHPNRKFLIHFHEHRLRFDQTFPEGLENRLPQEEFLAVLDRIHREMLAPLEVSQKRVNKWSRICFATAPIAVGFVLSFWLGSYARKHQRLFKNFWRTLKTHLKKINKDVYLARGIEWRIERDYAKVAEREAYSRWHNFRIEIIFRKPVKLRGNAERPSQIRITTSSNEEQPRTPVQRRITDPELLAVAAIAGTDNESFFDALGEIDNSYSESQYMNSFDEANYFEVAEDGVDNCFEEDEDAEETDEMEDTEEFGIVSNVSEPVGTEELSEADEEFTTFAEDLAVPEQAEEGMETSESKEPVSTEALETISTLPASVDTHPFSFATAVAIPIASASSTAVLASSPPVTTITSPLPRKKTYAEMIEAVQALSVDEEEPANHLSVIPEAPEFAINEDNEVHDAASFSSFAVRQQKKMERLSGAKPSESFGQLAAFSLVDPFAALYETDQVAPLYPPSPRSEGDETVEVDGDVEDLRRKKYRVAPERASRLSKVYSMTETIQPASRRTSYVPVNASLRKTMLG